jgi:hypothetical protein
MHAPRALQNSSPPRSLEGFVADLAGALEAASKAERVLVCAGGTTSEDQDRKSLLLDQHALLVGLAEAVSRHELTAPLIVAIMAPGQVAVPVRVSRP